MTNFGFRPLAGCGLFPQWQSIRASLKVSVPLRGVGCFDAAPHALHILCKVSVPLRGVGCFSWRYYYYDTVFCVSVPLRGVGCFNTMQRYNVAWNEFPSPCGVWVVSCRYQIKPVYKIEVSVPLRGVGCFSDKSIKPLVLSVSVPLRGVGCFPQSISQALQQLFPSPCGVWVVSNDRCNKTVNKIVSVPLRGVGCFKLLDMLDFLVGVSVPLRGVGCFSWRWSDDGIHCRFPSPCGVWVVSL